MLDWKLLLWKSSSGLLIILNNPWICLVWKILLSHQRFFLFLLLLQRLLEPRVLYRREKLAHSDPKWRRFFLILLIRYLTALIECIYPIKLFVIYSFILLKLVHLILLDRLLLHLLINLFDVIIRSRVTYLRRIVDPTFLQRIILLLRFHVDLWHEIRDFF
jgi:hypothetical protein